MIDESKSQEDTLRPFDISPSHPIWTQMERGVQIILGFSLVTGMHFLGESWGQPNVPYEYLFPALGSVGLAFIYSMLLTPIAGYIGMLLRAFTSLPGYRINQIRAVLFNIALLGLVVVFFTEASTFIAALADAAGLDPTSPEMWEHDFGDELRERATTPQEEK
jgi:hypothetical protein|tara:strand:+ start:3375 stop:3863 length:489 start_codon:yes stop_codon:yes gene_type:complete